MSWFNALLSHFGFPSKKTMKDSGKTDDLEEGKPNEEAEEDEDSSSPVSETKAGLPDNKSTDSEVPSDSSDQPVSEVESEETESEESDVESPQNEELDEALEEKQDTDAAESGENAEDEATEEAPVKPKPKPKWLELEPEDKTDPVPHLLKKYTERDDSWAFVAASVRGKLHAHKAMWREDSFAFDWTGPWSIMVVADGAGSVRSFPHRFDQSLRAFGIFAQDHARGFRA